MMHQMMVELNFIPQVEVVVDMEAELQLMHQVICISLLGLILLVGVKDFA